MDIRRLINKIIKWFLNEDKDKEYIIWCIKHGYTEDIKNPQDIEYSITTNDC